MRRLLALVRTAAMPVRIHTVAPGEDITALVADAVAAGARRIAVAGGDGTMRAAADALIGSGATLVPIPTGRLNHFARRAGIESLEAGVRRIGVHQVVRMTVGVVNDRLFLNTATFGMYAGVVRHRNRLPRWLGRWPAATIAFLHGYAGLRRFAVTLEADGIELRRSTPLFGARPSGPAPCRLDVAILVVRGRRDLTAFVARNAVAIARAQIPAQDHRVELLRTPALLVRAEHAFDVTLDGEPFRLPPPLSVALRHDALAVAAGENGPAAPRSRDPGWGEWR